MRLCWCLSAYQNAREEHKLHPFDLQLALNVHRSFGFQPEIYPSFKIMTSKAQDDSAPQDDSTLLPVGWERAQSSPSETYYIDHNTRTNYRERPTFDSNSVAPQDVGSQDLPVGWEHLSTPTGQAYFVNHRTRTTSWIDPRTLPEQTVDEIQGPFLNGWEMRNGRFGMPYFIDHNTRTTTWDDPRSLSFQE
jgi:E3 ubiquitin-protein ligase NEDD4